MSAFTAGLHSDDVVVFDYSNAKLVDNLGGIHGCETAAVAIDSLGLAKGNAYRSTSFRPSATHPNPIFS